MREAGVVEQDKLKQVLRRVSSSKHGWFEQYCVYLENRTQFNWAGSPVPKDRIEQINLCRIDLTHDPNIDSTWVKQSDAHFGKYAVSIFADELDLAVSTPEGDGSPEFPITINVTQRRLMTAIKDVRQFCAYVEAQGTRW